MRILVVTNMYPPEFVGGYELGCADMVDVLRGSGHEVLVVSSLSTESGQDETGIERILQLAPIYDDGYMAGLPPALAVHERLSGFGVNAANVGLLARVIERFEPDVAYLWNTLGLGAFGVLALMAQRDLPWVWHLMDQIPAHMCHSVPALAPLGPELSRLFPGTYIACSSHVVAETGNANVDLGDAVEIVPNWISGQRPPPRQSWSASGRLEMVTASGTLSELKGTDILIDAVTRLREDGRDDLHLDIYGRADDSRFVTEITRRGLGELITLRGALPRTELIERLQDYDLFVFPTWSREPFGFAPLEAAGRGCVPLFTDDCGIAEWLIDRVECLKAPRHSDGFAAIISEVLAGEIDLAALGRRAQTAAWDYFGLERCAARVERILAGAVSRDRPPRPAAPADDCFKLARLAERLAQTVMADSQL